jgi:hypothetical protein
MPRGPSVLQSVSQVVPQAACHAVCLSDRVRVHAPTDRRRGARHADRLPADGFHVARQRGGAVLPRRRLHRPLLQEEARLRAGARRQPALPAAVLRGARVHMASFFLFFLFFYKFALNKVIGLTRQPALPAAVLLGARVHMSDRGLKSLEGIWGSGLQAQGSLQSCQLVHPSWPLSLPERKLGGSLICTHLPYLLDS